MLNTDCIARAGVKLLLESKPALTIVAHTGDKEEALRMAEQEQPDIVLIHESIDSPFDPDFIPDLLAVTKKPRIILVTTLKDPEYHMRAVKKGVVGVVTAQNSPEILCKAIEKVHAGEVWLDRSLIASFVLQETRGNTTASANPQYLKISSLSDRERQIISLVGEGFKNQQIADQLYISEVTVRHHLTSIYKKLGVADRLELVIYAYQNSLAQIPG